MNSRAPRTRDDHDAVGGDDARAWRRASVSLSLSHDSSEGGASTRPRLDRSIASFDGSIDRSVGRSVIRSIDGSIDGSSAWTESESVVHRTICIYTYITINIPYQYTHHRLNPHTHPPRSSIESFSRVFHSFISRRVIRRLVSSRRSTRRRRLSIEWRRSTTSETTTIPILVFTPTGRSNECRVRRRWTRTIARARGFERRLSTTRRRRRANGRRRRDVDER